MRSWSDEEILAGIGDPERRREAFRALHARYAPRLLGVLARICRGDRERAQDLLGRVLYKAYQGLLRMERPCRSLPAWLYTVAARTALDELDRERREDAPSQCALNEEIQAATLPGDGEDGAPGLALAVEAVLARLERESPRYRTLLEMEHVGACTREEIAEATGIERKQLSQYLKRARERFVQFARDEPVLRERMSSREGECR